MINKIYSISAAVLMITMSLAIITGKIVFIPNNGAIVCEVL